MTLELDYWTIADLVGDGESIYTDYSGRGMYGDTCFGLTFDSITDFVEFVKAVTEVVTYESVDEVTTPLTNFYDNYLTKVSTDSMGLSTIYYWPRVKLVNVPEHALD